MTNTSTRFAPGFCRAAIISFMLGLLAAPVLAQLSAPLQPMAQQVRRLEDALNYLGQPFPAALHDRINEAIAMEDEAAAVARLQELLDPQALAVVSINPESRVKVTQGAAKPVLVERGTRLFLVKVVNEAGVTAPLEVESPNSGPTYLRSRGEKEPAMELTEQHVKDRWADISIHSGPPMAPRLSGLGVEYQILSIYSRDSGQRSAKIAFNVGQGTQGHRLPQRHPSLVQHRADPARHAACKRRERQSRRSPASSSRTARAASIQPHRSAWRPTSRFRSRSIARMVKTCASRKAITRWNPPAVPSSLLVRKNSLSIKMGPGELSIQLQRWIDPSKYGWWSGDHHIHASGCSHYKNPTEGVLPEDMMRQVLGENLNIGSVLTWGPSWYYQKQFFEGQKDHDLSKPERLDALRRRGLGLSIEPRRTLSLARRQRG